MYGSVHTNKIVFSDDTDYYTNTWSWTMLTAPSLYASNSLPIGSLKVRGFKANMVVTPGPFDNSLANAFAVLGYPATNASAVTLAATNIVQSAAWDIGTIPNDVPLSKGLWVTNFPGLCYPTAYSNYFAAQAQAYLQLTNGPHRFHVYSDDAGAVYSGANVTDTSTVLATPQVNDVVFDITPP